MRASAVDIFMHPRMRCREEEQEYCVLRMLPERTVLVFAGHDASEEECLLSVVHVFAVRTPFQDLAVAWKGRRSPFEGAGVGADGS